MAETVYAEATIDGGATALVRLYQDGSTFTRVEWLCTSGRYRLYVGTADRTFSKIIPAAPELASHTIERALSDRLRAQPFTLAIEGF